MYRNPTEPRPESAVSPWMASILMRRGGSAWQRFALTYHQLLAMPRRWRRQLRRKAAVGLGSAALVLALAGPIVAAPALQPAAPEATITVVNGEVADVQNNKCSLIEAIINARAKQSGPMRPDCATGNINGPDTISLPNNGEFVLTEGHNEQFGPSGLPVITSAVTIEGHGSTIRRSSLSGTPDFRILAVDDNGSLTLRDMTVTNGRITSGLGGGWYYDWTYGGGIFSLGALTLSSVTVSDNTVWGNLGLGGGVYVDGPTTITNSVISGNEASGSSYAWGGGLAAYLESDVTITNSVIQDNYLSANTYNSFGGGIATFSRLTISDSTIAGNTNRGGGGLAWGGGVFVFHNAQATITGSTLSGNAAEPYLEGYADWEPGMGGGLANDGNTLIANSTISGNTANNGGGVANLFFGTLTIVESTLSANQAVLYPSYNEPEYWPAGGYGGGIFAGKVYGRDMCGTTTLEGVIVSGNSAAYSGPQAFFKAEAEHCDHGAPAMLVDAFNVFGQNDNHGLVGFSPGASDIVPAVGLNALLSPLAGNGGPTLTHALPAGSPALDRAPNALCSGPSVDNIDQRGEPRNQNGTGGATNTECDAGAYERAGTPTAQLGFYLSASGAGNVGGVAFAPGDIIKFTPGGGWSMHFDASDVGLTKNVSAFEIEDNGHILLALGAPQNVPGVGNVQAQDVLRFTPTATGNNTAGSFTMALDGSANLLTTSGEKIDALARAADNRLAISTSGAAVVKRPNNSVLKAQDEDALGFNLTNSQWSEFFNGTAIPGLKAEDVNALWIDPATGDLYISIVGTFNLGGVAGNGRDIVRLSPSGAPGGYTPSLAWDGSDNGFPTNIDGLEMIP